MAIPSAGKALRRIAWLTPVRFVLILLSSAAALAQQPTPATPPTVAPVSRDIPRPAELQRDVDFWIRVYSEITTLQGFLHDERNLAIVYSTLSLPPTERPGSPVRRQLIDAERERWSKALREAADSIQTESLADGATERGSAAASADAQRVIELWGAEASADSLRLAAESVRFQLGQADRFRAGIVRSGQWESHIARTFDSLGLPPELAALPHVESSFTPTAYSKVGASGLWQFMPGTGRRFMRVDDIVDERLDPFRATEAAAKLLLYNYRTLGSWPLAITAYNHGTAGMRRAREQLGTDDFAVIARRYQSRSFGFASRNFYPSFLAALTIDQNPQRYFPDVQRATELVFHEVSMPGYAEVATLERALGIPRETLRELNPALRPAVWSGEKFVPRGYRLRLPSSESLSAAQLIAQVGADRLFVAQLAPRTHTVAPGETLTRIAKRYGFSVADLAQINELPADAKLRRGQRLRLADERPATLASALSLESAAGAAP
ncbi:MAG: LysM peptidoglycan-binding domain-containing protein [Sinobacteraceae bacterium]|nr:LysM peptidoglycan-binding domain-containing protein [Nevskiaceae bacterium]